ncbi:MAG TPA: hypothetical protein VKA74_00405 [Myxococcota bacterium]|nr:hypothetical protein [Myxococcota bacterium]
MKTAGFLHRLHLRLDRRAGSEQEGLEEISMGGHKDEKHEKKDKKERKKLLAEIQESVHDLAREQRALRNEVSRLSSLMSRSLTQQGDEPLWEVLTFLEDYRLLESAGEKAFAAWIESCQDDRLRGGLRTIRMRESIHARLLQDRILALGGGPREGVSEHLDPETVELFGSRALRDEEKLRELVSRYPDIDAALAPLCEMAERLGPDHETRALLETIVEDERATLGFLHAEWARLDPDRRP